jgi:hypothetical protein
MCSSHFIKDRLSRFETQMVGIVEAETTAGQLELFIGQTFERGLGCDGHEDGELDKAMWKKEV